MRFAPPEDSKAEEIFLQTSAAFRQDDAAPTNDTQITLHKTLVHAILLGAANRN
jgi:hypothetical protein